MSSPKNIHDELRNLGSNLPFNNNQPFSVPEGYFDGLAATILAKINRHESTVRSELEELSPFLASFPKQTPYAIPSSYFEENTNALASFIQMEESALLQNIGRTTPYEVPSDYFETLPTLLLNKVSKPATKVVPMFARTWMRIASAAAVAGALFFGGYQLLSNDSGTADTTTAVQTSSKPEEKLVASNLAPFEKEIKKVSTKELEDFIETVQVSTTKPSVKEQAGGTTNQVKDLLEDVSTSEMESFLSALPTADDELLIID